MSVPEAVTAVAPVRIADLGGWTDTWFSSHGVVCSVAVQPGARVTVEMGGRGDDVTVVASNFGNRYSLRSGRGTHPLLEAAIDEVGVPPGRDVTVTVASTVPAGASTGTSAAVTVALVGALEALRRGGKSPDPAAVAATAHRIETLRLGRQCGIQDQLASAHGGVNRIDMTSYPEAVVTPIPLEDEVRTELERRLLLVFLGRPHVSSAMHEAVIASLTGADASVVDRQLEPLRAAALAGAAALSAGDLEAYGAALVANTEAQRRLHDGLVSGEVRRLFEAASAAGASGWKVNGAGGEGGSVTILCGPGPTSCEDVVGAVMAVGRSFVVIPTTIDVDGLRVSPSGGTG
ncbi:MAG TPA: hypothetical protein VM143_07200 [Acidimicrobiales bacterium]|nr:hypothetical protein [Acidimicrobiales bacterium]